MLLIENISEDSTDDDDDEEECVYECLYDSLPVSQEKELKQQDSSLVKIAEVAERSIKKLRRNWSIKKDDLSKGLSKIKRSSKTLIEDVYTKEGINLEQNILRVSRDDFNLSCGDLRTETGIIFQ